MCPLRECAEQQQQQGDADIVHEGRARHMGYGIWVIPFDSAHAQALRDEARRREKYFVTYKAVSEMLFGGNDELYAICYICFIYAMKNSNGIPITHNMPSATFSPQDAVYPHASGLARSWLHSF